ncbi:MAG: DUF4249 family protein [Leadbetterella sp.]|nr:DUF4249 family protein [Leadbetterella sp.]
MTLQHIISFRTIYFIIISSFLFFGCKKFEFEEIRLKHNENSLVVYSLLCPGKNVIVNIRQVLNINDSINYNFNNKNIDEVSGALVILSNYNRSHQDTLKELIPSIYGLDSNALKIQKGEKYFLEVFYKKQFLSASCTIPINEFVPEISEVKFVPESTKGNVKQDSHIIINISTKTLLNREYVFLKDYRIDYDLFGKKLQSLSLVNYYDVAFDITRNFQVIVPAFGIGVYKRNFKYTLATTTKEVYSFFKSIYENDQQRVNFEQNPIFAFNSIYPHVSNIKGGYGIFGGYVESIPIEMEVTKDSTGYLFGINYNTWR